MENTTMRKATLEDKKEVLAINENVFDGRDYLPALYDRLISSSNTIMFVLLYEKKIIGFAGVSVVDDGKTGVGRAARVSPKFKGFHLGKQFMHQCADWFKGNGVTRIAATEIQHGNIINNHDNYKLVLCKFLLAYLVNVNQLRLHSLHDSYNTRLTHATDRTLSTYFASKKISTYLFPHARILVNGIPYRLINTNISLITRENDITEMFTNVNEINDNCRGLFSIGTSYPTKNPSYAYNLEIYGEDDCSLECHVVQHLRRLTERTSGVVSLHVFLNDMTLESKMDHIFSKYDIKRECVHRGHESNDNMAKRVLFEMDFPLQSRY